MDSSGYASGYATNFADPRDLARYRKAKAAGKSEQYALSVGDNGIGAPALGGVETPNTYGVAVPRSYLVQQFGNDPAAWRRARAQVTVNDQTVLAPVVDLGPGGKQQRNGVVTDLTSALSNGVGGTGKDRAELQLIGNAGPDVVKDRETFDSEQNQIGTQLSKSGYGASLAAATTPTESGSEYGSSLAASATPAETGLYAGQDLNDALTERRLIEQLQNLA